MNKNKLPDTSGMWEWFDENGTKKEIDVCEIFPGSFRVYSRGGYYNIADTKYGKAEWPDRWGNYVGRVYFEVPEEDVYSKPTPERMSQIRDLYKNPQDNRDDSPRLRGINKQLPQKLIQFNINQNKIQYI